jgi:hypothetical protein
VYLPPPTSDSTPRAENSESGANERLSSGQEYPPPFAFPGPSGNGPFRHGRCLEVAQPTPLSSFFAPTGRRTTTSRAGRTSAGVTVTWGLAIAISDSKPRLGAPTPRSCLSGWSSPWLSWWLPPDYYCSSFDEARIAGGRPHGLCGRAKGDCNERNITPNTDSCVLIFNAMRKRWAFSPRPNL